MSKEIKQWITVNGQHIPIYEGESKKDAVNRAIQNKDEDDKQKQIAKNKKEADSRNNKEPEGFEDRAMEYVGGGYEVDRIFTKEDIKYIKDNSEYTNKPMYRVEDEKFNYKAFMEEGEIQGLGGSFRSFTSDFSFIRKALDESGDQWAGIENPVVYEVLGRKKSFDMEYYGREYAKYYGSQHEHLVGGEFEPIKQREEKIAGQKIRIVTLRWMED